VDVVADTLSHNIAVYASFVTKRFSMLEQLKVEFWSQVNG